MQHQVRTFEDPSARVKLRHTGMAWRRVVDDVLVLDIDQSRYHSVNATGTVLWERLVAGASVGELTSALTAEHPEARDRAGGDLAQFLSDLDERGLLEPAEGGQR